MKDPILPPDVTVLPATTLKWYTLFALLLAAAHAFSVEPHKELVTADQPIVHPLVRTKILAEGYAQLCEAIEADDIAMARQIFSEFPGLAPFSYQSAGTPLHFVKSLAMARFLTQEIGISVNVCDEWGETPSYAIAHSNPNRFISIHEKKTIACYLKKQERFLPKLKSQLLSNKDLHMKLSVAAMGSIMTVNLAVLVEIFLIKYKTLRGL